MVNTIDLESQGQKKGGLTKQEIIKRCGNSAWRILASLAFLTSSCATVVDSQTTSNQPAETVPVPGANEPQLAMQAFEINKEYPEALQPYVDVFENMAAKDKLDLNLVNNFDFILARDAAKGTTVEYALMPMAVVNGLTDPDNEPANQKPVYYLAYKDEQGQVIGNYVLGRLLEQDSEGNVSYVSRILADASFQDWLNNTQPADSQIDLGQIVYATALANGIDIKQARKIEQQLTGGELSSADFMKQYALGVSFIQPGQAARQVTIVNPLISGNTPAEPSIAPSFWSRLFGVQPALAAGLELEATATAPGSTPIIEPTPSAEPTPTIEPTPTAEPTQSPEQALVEFKESAEYKQGLQDYLDAMGLQEENVTITEEVKVINGQEYRFLVVAPKKNTLTADQQLFVHFYEPVPLFLFLEGDFKRIGIRDLSDPFNINFGNLILGRQKSNPTYAEIMKRDFGATLVDWQLQWIRTQPDKTGNIRLNDASSLFSFTNMLEQSTDKDYIKIGQPLVWEKPDFLPEYLFDLNEKELKEEIIHHVESLILAAGDDVDIWTVVNEAETWPENRGKGYDWLFDKLGEQYLIEAFKTAYQTDPSKVLLYSDFANETVSGIKHWQTARVIELVQKEGIPISVGMHMRIDVQNPPTKDKLKEAFQDYGVDIYITEFTLDLSKIPTSDSSRLLQQANAARTIVEAILEYNQEAKLHGYPNSVKLVGFFGIQDSINFLEEADGKNNADPTLFDDNLNPKPAYYAILETLYRLLDFRF